MRRALLPLFLVTCVPCWWGLAAETETLTPAALPAFLGRNEKDLDLLDAAYEDLASENLPLHDESGQPLARHRINDRRQALVDLRRLLRQLAKNPEDLILATQTLLQTETLTDDLFDLSQIAYDNDREELARRLADLTSTMDRNKDLIETYTLALATEKQRRLEELEGQNRDLQQKLREATRPKPAPKAAPRSQPRAAEKNP